MLLDVIPEVPPQLVGPVSALALAIIVIVALGRFTLLLWRVHLEATGDDRMQRDRAFDRIVVLEDLLRISLENNRAAVAAWNRRNDADAARHRKADS